MRCIAITAFEDYRLNRIPYKLDVEILNIIAIQRNMYDVFLAYLIYSANNTVSKAAGDQRAVLYNTE